MQIVAAAADKVGEGKACPVCKEGTLHQGPMMVTGDAHEFLYECGSCRAHVKPMSAVKTRDERR